MVARRITPDEEHDVGALEILELHRPRPRPQHARHPHAAGLMAVEGAVVDVIGAVEAGEELEEEARFVARAAAEIEERLRRRGALHPLGDPRHRVVPTDRLVVLLPLLEYDRLHEPPRMLQLVGGELLQLRDRVGGEEVALHPPLHVGHHRLKRLLADFRKMPRLVHHPPRLPPHPQRAGLAGVLRAHRLPELPDAPRLTRLLQRVEDRPPATARLHPHVGNPFREDRPRPGR